MQKLFLTVGVLTMIAIGVRGADAAPRGATCFGESATIVRGSGNDTIYATNFRDVIVAGAGDDYVSAREGSDLVCGGEGDDELHGGDGTDQTDGGAGDDFVDGRRGVDDTLLGGSGADKMLGGGVLQGGPGPDRISSASYENEDSIDVVKGGDGNDDLFGDGSGGFGERLLGGKGNDRIAGGRAKDDLDGGSGNDRLFSSNGADQLDGGPQHDRCEQDNNDVVTRCEEIASR